jgi:hypothetical protein
MPNRESLLPAKNKKKKKKKIQGFQALSSPAWYWTQI